MDLKRVLLKLKIVGNEGEFVMDENKISLIIITGLSGAGKTKAIQSFEDMGYFCADNIPPTLIPKFAEICWQTDGKINKVALVVDIRGRDFFDTVMDSLVSLEELGFPYKVLFLEATDEVLVNRFKESRRKHPLSVDGRILDCIKTERAILRDIKKKATMIIDTSRLTPKDLKNVIMSAFAEGAKEDLMTITVMSFGFKEGLPLDADLVFDVRFLPNPFYIEDLREKTGKEEDVKEYVLKGTVTRDFLKKTLGLLKFLIPHYIKEGKSHLLIAIGCTGGRHRSVAIAAELGRMINDLNYRIIVEHRDVFKETGDLP